MCLCLTVTQAINVTQLMMMQKIKVKKTCMICYTVSYVWGMHCLNDGAEMREERFSVGVNRMDRVRQ